LNTITLAEKLGTTPHISALLRKAARLGVDSPERLEGLAVARGCWHYRNPDPVAAFEVPESSFTNEELATALLSPCLPYSAHTIRVGAAILGATGNDVEVLARLAVGERCISPMRYIADAAMRFEPDNSFWQCLLARLPQASPVKDGVMPHPTRFVSMTGMTRSGMQPVTVWIRPRPELVQAHG
jgi:hypothetical protein